MAARKKKARAKKAAARVTAKSKTSSRRRTAGAASAPVSVNTLAAPIVENLVDNQQALRVKVYRLKNGVRIVDAGIDVAGGLEVGRMITEICMGGMGRARIRSANVFGRWKWHIDVHSTNPVLACLASQYAGWSLSHGSGREGFNALGSGPARALGSREELFHELAYRDRAGAAVMVIEVDKAPPVELTQKIAEMCKVRPRRLTLILTPTSSLAGSVQVVGRVLEVAMHKVHAVGFPLEEIVDGAASAPLCPPAPDFLNAMGRTNDAIIFGGQVHLFVASGDEAAQELAIKLPSNGSRDFGKPFAQIFKDYGYDFYRIDPMLFSPARAVVTSMKTGRTFQAGALHEELLDRSFGVS
ncbi:MAG: methenyltetrahydromethanopterin cyclohydrolase [Gammaproteobacteria bacterium]